MIARLIRDTAARLKEQREDVEQDELEPMLIARAAHDVGAFDCSFLDGPDAEGE